MALIAKRGSLPTTPHTEFYAKKDVLALEEIHGAYGFSGAWTRKLHVRHYPTEQIKAPKLANFDFKAETPAEADVLQPFLIQTDDIPVSGDALRGRAALVFGSRTKVSILKPTLSFPKETFFRNGEHHEVFYVHQGSGKLSSEFGELNFEAEQYIVVPKGTTYRIDLETPSAWLLIVESTHPIEWPGHYMNQSGQATLVSPVVETEIQVPELQEAIDHHGDYKIYVQHTGGLVTETVLGHHPFDVVGWEGALYPFIFEIKNHHGIAREIHTAPPAHQTFQSGNVPYGGFSLCSFVPQPDGWHPKDVPAPYAHLNVDSDEVMFFCNKSYGARKGIVREGSFTFHPGSVPHSPHGDAALRSLKSRGKMSERLAVMLDTYFESLQIAEIGFRYRDKKYAESWSSLKK